MSVKLIIEKYLGRLNKQESIFAMDSPCCSKKPLRVGYPKTYSEDDLSGEEKKNILIDFDGVIHKYSKGFNDGTIYDSPTDGAKEAIDKLKRKYKIVIFSARLSPSTNPDFEDQRKNMIDWLSKYGIYYDVLSYEKVPAVAYIDDLAINFIGDWEDTLNKVEELVNKQKTT